MKEPPVHQESATTNWSLVVVAKADEASQNRAGKAPQELCTPCWYPLHAFVRYRGYSANEVENLTQSFFVRTIETRGSASADPERGRFRICLFKHVVASVEEPGITADVGDAKVVCRRDRERHNVDRYGKRFT